MRSFKDVLDKIKPCLAKEVIETNIAIYKESYKSENKGKNPTKAQIDTFIQLITSNGTATKQTNEFLQDIEKLVFKEKAIKLFTNSLFTISTLTVSGFTAFICLAPTTPAMILDRYTPALIGFSIPSIMIFAAVLIQTVISINRR